MWQNFTMLGDQFIVAYSRLDAQTVPVTLFTVGHAVELYLKATILKIDPDFDILSLGHRIDKMILKVNELEPTLLNSYKLKEDVYVKFMNGVPVTIEQSADPSYEHYVINQELYWVSKYLLDLKYLGTIHKSMPQTFSIFIRACNPYWLNFFIELRKFLGWPTENQYFDFIKKSFENQLIHKEQEEFLKALTN
jgi:hypothetical protein